MWSLSGIPIRFFFFLFYFIFIIASFRGLQIFNWNMGVNKKLPLGETSQNAFQSSRSISWSKTYTWQNVHTTFKHLKNISLLISSYKSVTNSNSINNKTGIKIRFLIIYYIPDLTRGFDLICLFVLFVCLFNRSLCGDTLGS